MRHTSCLALVGSLIACGPVAAPRPAPDTAAELRELLARPFPHPVDPVVPLVEGVRLDLALAAEPTSLAVGDALELGLSVVNESDQPIEIALPACGSWGDGGTAYRYGVELVAEDGEVVPGALGWAPDEDCYGPADVRRVTVEPGARATLDVALPEARRSVLPSARDGHYRLRIRYDNEALGATPLSLVSNEVEVEVTGGDDRLWRCRLDQLLGVESFHTVDHAFPTLVAADPTAPAAGVFAIYARESLGPGADGDALPSGVALVRMAGDGAVERSLTLWPTRAVTPRRVHAVRTPTGLFVATELDHAELWVGRVALDASLTPRPGEPTRLGATYPDFHALGLGRWVAVAYGDVLDGPLLLARLALSGPLEPVGAPLVIAQHVDPSGVVVAAGEDGSFTVVYGGHRAIRARRVGSDGALGEERSLPIGGDPVAARVVSDGLEIAYVDNSSTNDGVMGSFRVRLDATGAIVGEPVAVTPTSDRESHPAAVAWSARGAAAIYETWGDARSVAARVEATYQPLSERGASGVDILALGAGYAVAWADQRDDTSAACRVQNLCVAEIYGAYLDERGALRGEVHRLTHEARPQPTPALDVGWELFCPPEAP